MVTITTDSGLVMQHLKRDAPLVSEGWCSVYGTVVNITTGGSLTAN